MCAERGVVGAVWQRAGRSAYLGYFCVWKVAVLRSTREVAGVTVEGHAARVGERRHATHVLHVWCKAKAQGVAQGGGHAGGGGGTQGVWRRCAGAVCRHRWLAAGVVQGQPC